MQALVNWWKNHGDKLFAKLNSVQLLLQYMDPTLLSNLLGAKAPLWVAFGTGIVTLYHTVFVTPTTPVLQSQISSNVAKVTAKTPLPVILFALALFGAAICSTQLTGCATTGTAPTFNQLVSAAGQVDNTVLATVDSLVNSKAISSAQASAILAITDKVQAALTLANTANAAGNQATAQAKLTAASAALASIQGCLTAPSTLAVCLQGVTAP